MPKINGYYELKTASWNWVPIKVVKEEKEEIFTFENLITNENGKENSVYIRETAIEQVHLDRIGFKNEFLGDLIAYRISLTVGDDLANLAFGYFGYSIFNKSDYDNFIAHYSKMNSKIQNEYKKNPSIITSPEIRAEWGTIFYINELFDVLENKYNVSIPNKKNIIIGI